MSYGFVFIAVSIKRTNNYHGDKIEGQIINASLIGTVSILVIPLNSLETCSSNELTGTSLLILVGVVLDTLQQIESHLLMRHYDGLLSSGRIHGRSGVR